MRMCHILNIILFITHKIEKKLGWCCFELDDRVIFTIQKDLKSITEQMRQFVSKKYEIESIDDGISIPMKGHLIYNFTDETLILSIDPN